MTFSKILYNFVSIYILRRIFSSFFITMSTQDPEIKNLKISKEVHDILKKYCEKRGIKIYRFLENLIKEKCSEKKDLYGEN